MHTQSHRPQEELNKRSSKNILTKSQDFGKGLLQRMRNTVGKLSREVEADIEQSANRLPESLRSMIAQVDIMHADLKRLIMNEVLQLGLSSKRVAKAALSLVAESYLSACGAKPNVVADFSAQLKGYETRLSSTEMLLRSAPKEEVTTPPEATKTPYNVPPMPQP